MIEVPIDFIRRGDILGKHHSFKRYEGGMSSTVNLMKGYVLTEKVLGKLKEEFNIQYLCIADMSDDVKDIELEEGFDEIERQKIVDTFIENMNQIKTSMTLDLKAIGAVVTDILNSVFRFIKNGKGSFRTVAKAFSEVQSHDMFTWDHSVNTAIYSAIIAFKAPEIFNREALKYPDARFSRHEILVFNMLFHDVGKIRIPLKILNKTEKLTNSEIETIQKHPYNGFAYIRKINDNLRQANMPLIPAYFSKACLLHHQAYDGSGYPPLRRGPDEIRPYRGEEIPEIARIASVADIYDAVTSKRAHRFPLHPVEATNILQSERGKKLDPEITDAFLEAVTPFPVGSTVMLTTNELAVVTGYVNDNKMYPVVRPYMRKVFKDGKERIERLPYRNSINIIPRSKIKIAINKDLYELNEEREVYP